jgi:hypothetical protein
MRSDDSLATLGGQAVASPLGDEDLVLDAEKVKRKSSVI